MSEISLMYSFILRESKKDLARENLFGNLKLILKLISDMSFSNGIIIGA